MKFHKISEGWLINLGLVGASALKYLNINKLTFLISWVCKINQGWLINLG